jgi:hypothetical protein
MLWTQLKNLTAFVSPFSNYRTNMRILITIIGLAIAAIASS